MQKKLKHMLKIHSGNVAFITYIIGREIGLSNTDLELLYDAAFYHDIGKIYIPQHILLKPYILTDEEYAIVKKHTLLGGYHHTLLDKNKKYRFEVALLHHERFDGSGYPFGLKGRNIPLFARITAIADSFAAIIEDRPYKDGLSFNDAFNELMEDEGKYDVELLNVFNKVFINGLAEVIKK